MKFELTDRQKQTRQMAHMFAKTQVRPIAAKHDRDGTMPWKLMKMMHGSGGMAMSMMASDRDKKKYKEEADKDRAERHRRKGGRGEGAVMGVIGAEELAWGCSGIAMALGSTGLGMLPIQSMGTPEQKDKWLGFLRGKEFRLGAMAMTEPGGGSDTARIQTTARKDGDHYILNGRKCFITGGASADIVSVYAMVDKSAGRAGMRCFIVEKGTPGFIPGKIEKKMGLRASETAELIFDECRVPADNLLGGEELKGKGGFYGAMNMFDSSRPGVGAVGLGVARASFEYALDFCRARIEHGKPLINRNSTARILGSLARRIDAARLLIWKAAWMGAEGIPNAKEAAASKYYGCDLAVIASRDAIEIMGPEGALPSHPVEKWFRDSKLWTIGEGTTQIQQRIIARHITGLIDIP